MRRGTLSVILFTTVSWLLAAQPRVQAEDRHPLSIYFIDVEGGQSTLIVTPEGEAMLIDAGYPGPSDRDPNRIMAALADAGVTGLEYLFITHYHQDHVGGVAAIARRVPIRAFVAHGDPVDDDPIYQMADRRAYADYQAARGEVQERRPKPGDRLPLKGVEILVSNGAGMTLEKPVPGGGRPNAACGTYARHEDDPGENASSLGLWLRYGKFRFVDTGDLNWNKLGQLSCPRNLLGTVDVYLASHHGNLDANVPEFIMGLQPRVVVLNNGARKGGAPATFATLRQIPSIDSVWQLHWSTNDGAQNFEDDVIANPTTATAYWLKLTASRDGSFTMTNSRNGYSKRYPPYR